MNNIPIELVDIIISYLVADCNHCFKETHYTNMQRKVTINQYKSIFDDDYFMPKQSVFFNRICNKCLKIYFIDDHKFIYSLVNHQKSENVGNCFCKLHT